MDSRTLQEAYGNRSFPSPAVQRQVGQVAMRSAEHDLGEYHERHRAAVFEMERTGQTVAPEEHLQGGLGVE